MSIKMRKLLSENKNDDLSKSHQAIINSIDEFIKQCEIAKKIKSEPWIENRLSNFQSEYKELKRAVASNNATLLSTSNKLFGTDHAI